MNIDTCSNVSICMLLNEMKLCLGEESNASARWLALRFDVYYPM